MSDKRTGKKAKATPAAAASTSIDAPVAPTDAPRRLAMKKKRK